MTEQCDHWAIRANIYLDTIQALVEQDCVEVIGGKQTDYYNSQFITVYAEAMRVLGAAGRMIIEYDDGGRYVAGVFI